MKSMQLFNFVYSLFCFVVCYIVPTLCDDLVFLVLDEALISGVFCGVFILHIQI
jgi:hypothetical protein